MGTYKFFAISFFIFMFDYFDIALLLLLLNEMVIIACFVEITSFFYVFS